MNHFLCCCNRTLRKRPRVEAFIWSHSFRTYCPSEPGQQGGTAQSVTTGAGYVHFVMNHEAEPGLTLKTSLVARSVR